MPWSPISRFEPWMLARAMSTSAWSIANKTAGGAVAEHDLVSEVYHVIDGSATLVAGLRYHRFEAAAGG